MTMTAQIIPRCLRAVAAAALLAVAASAWAQDTAAPAARKPLWEVVTLTDPASVPSEQAAPDLAVSVRDGGIILISTDKAVTVKVFSILGQLITQKHITPGTVRLSMDGHGIYILKADNVTRRINL